MKILSHDQDSDFIPAVIATMADPTPYKGTVTANAEHIVRCVNSHDDLLAACEKALVQLHRYATGEEISEDDACDACADLEAAIQKAGG